MKDTHQSYDKKEQKILLHKYIHELQEPYKEVVMLRSFADMSFDEVGSVLGKSENWARVTFYRAKMKLKERMMMYEDEL